MYDVTLILFSGLGHDVVTKLSTDYWHKYHHIFADNYFTSVDLVKYLLDKSTYLTGTIKANRKWQDAAITHPGIQCASVVQNNQK